MTDYSELKRLAEAAGCVDWSWWTSNSALRLTTECNGRHGADGDAISAHRDSVECPEVYRAFIENASPANVSALIAEIEALRKAALAAREFIMHEAEVRGLLDENNEVSFRHPRRQAVVAALDAAMAKGEQP